ncbi:MAG TPA: EboA domain-containing protein [Segetibacter sp.]|nr:EboA domain-containing protein [Segetibacter sp.]
MLQSRQSVLKDVFAGIIKRNVTADIYSWLLEKNEAISQEKTAAQLNMTFAAVPRKTGRQFAKLTKEEQERLKEVHPQFTVDEWTIDRLSRVWLLLQIDSSDKENYFRKIENLFKAAEMNELVALYSALPGLAYGEDWQKQCADGIRSNIGIVLEAIMYNNPYPQQYLSEQAWNQLVMKAFFTDKDVRRIIGLDERANKELADILVDYASERRAAHRNINPQLWRLVTRFIDDTNFANILKAFNSSDIAEKKAAAFACYNSNYNPAKNLLENEPDLKSAIVENKLSWNSL